MSDRRHRSLGRLVMAHDVTGRLLAEPALARSTAEFVAAFDYAPAGMALIGPDREILNANPALSEISGHPVGDRMLREVAETLRASLRPYDLVIRYGGDEFVCALPGMDLSSAQVRLQTVNRALADAAEPGSVTIGLAELRPGESVNHLVARADAALLRERHQRRATPDGAVE